MFMIVLASSWQRSIYEMFLWDLIAVTVTVVYLNIAELRLFGLQVNTGLNVLLKHVQTTEGLSGHWKHSAVI